MILALFRIVAPEGKRRDIVEALEFLKGPTGVSRGCRACRIFQDVENENALTYLEQWETQADLEAHLQSRYFRQLLPLIDMSAEPPEIVFSTFCPVQGMDYVAGVLGEKSR